MFFIVIVSSSVLTMSYAENPAFKSSEVKQDIKQEVKQELGNSNNFDSLKYTLGPGDVISITVRNHPEFSGTYSINLEGEILYSYVGDVNVVGLTQVELEKKIKGIILTYVVAPEVKISILGYESKVFFVLGEVAKPGQYHMHAETISVEDAVIMAGLPIQTAAINKAKIITPGLNGGTIKKVNLYNLLYLGDLKENILLNPGDSLIVPAAVKESVENKRILDNNFDPLTYTLGPDDVIAIKVIDHPDFSGIFPINKEGKIQYSFVGDIDVTGLTRGQLERKLKKILSPYVDSPEIDVTITEFKSKVFYVMGEVGAPGKYFMRADNITVSEAVVTAGFPTVDAAMRKTIIITPSISGPITRKVNLYKLLYFGDLNENLLLKPGDYLYVPSTILAKVIRIVSPVSTTIGLAVGPAVDAGNAKQVLISK